jgi:hypothetical protein
MSTRGSPWTVEPFMVAADPLKTSVQETIHGS